MDQRRVLAEFEANGGTSSCETNDISEETVHDNGHESVEVYLAHSGVGSENISGRRRVMQVVQLVSMLLKNWVRSAFVSARVFH